MSTADEGTRFDHSPKKLAAYRRILYRQMFGRAGFRYRVLLAHQDGRPNEQLTHGQMV
jgi:hypothetical protein